jgi:hypothetical protein
MDTWQGFLDSLPFTIHQGDAPLPWRRLWVTLVGWLITLAALRNIVEGNPRHYRPYREWVSHCLWGVLQVFYANGSWYWANVMWFVLDAMTVIHHRHWITHTYGGGDERVWQVRAIVEGGFVLCWLVASSGYYTWFYVQVVWGLIWSPLAFAVTFVIFYEGGRKVKQRRSF